MNIQTKLSMAKNKITTHQEKWIETQNITSSKTVKNVLSNSLCISVQF